MTVNLPVNALPNTCIILPLNCAEHEFLIEVRKMNSLVVA